MQASVARARATCADLRSSNQRCRAWSRSDRGMVSSRRKPSLQNPLSLPAEPSQLRGIGDDVDLRDPALGHDEPYDRDRLLPWDHDHAAVAVHDRWARKPRERRAAFQDLSRDGFRAFHRRSGPRRDAAGVDSEDDGGVEYLEQRLEVAVA